MCKENFFSYNSSNAKPLQYAKAPTFYAWRLVNGKKVDVFKIKNAKVKTKEQFKQLALSFNVIFDGVDIVHG